MTSSKDMPPTLAPLAEVVRSREFGNRVGRMTLDESIAFVIKGLNRDIEEATDPSDPRYNGLSLKDKKGLSLQQAQGSAFEEMIKPLGCVVVALSRAIMANRGSTTDLKIPPEYQSMFGRQASINMMDLEAQAVGAYNRWLQAADGAGVSDRIPLPLAINDPARTASSQGIGRISDLTTTSGMELKKPLTNETALQLMRSREKTNA